jgi:hypothetical protein
MNLPGLQQRLAAGCYGQKGGGTLAVVFESRPVSVSTTRSQRGTAVRGAEIRPHRHAFSPAWNASVRDEIHATAGGAVRRHITILITEGTRFEVEEIA